jgi:hypothetical protein
MAVLRSFTCRKCGKPTREARCSGDYSDICGACTAKEANQKRREFLAGRAALSVEERLALLEEWIYDYRPPRSIHDTFFG